MVKMIFFISSVRVLCCSQSVTYSWILEFYTFIRVTVLLIIISSLTHHCACWYASCGSFDHHIYHAIHLTVHLAALKAAHAFLRDFTGVRTPCASVWSPDCSQPGGGGSSLIESFIHAHCAHIVMCKGEKGRRELRWPVWSFHIVNIPRCVSTKRRLGAQRTSNIFFTAYCTVQAFITHTRTGTCKARNWD